MNINATAMHHQPRRFINRDEVLVLVEDGEFGLHDIFYGFGGVCALIFVAFSLFNR